MIDYNNLHKSTIYYEERGFKRIEAPWTVSEYVDNITKPKDIPSLKLEHNGKCLVASGEQSFLYLYLKNFLPLGRYQSITPCFRGFESFDYTHSKYFMKNELIQTDAINTYELENITDICLSFYQQFFQDQLEVIKTDEGFDIEINGQELGSYGIRSCEFLDWIYATGCAEPRLSSIVNYNKKLNK